MTKRNLVFLPCLVIALAFLGCQGGGGSDALNSASGFTDGTSSSIMSPQFAGGDSGMVRDPHEFTGNSGLEFVPQETYGLEPVSRNLYLARVDVMRQGGAMYEGMERDPKSMPNDPRMMPAPVTAKDLGNGITALTKGDQTAYLYETEINGVLTSISLGVDGVPSINGPETFPKVFDDPEAGRVVLLVDGTGSFVETE